MLKMPWHLIVITMVLKPSQAHRLMSKLIRILIVWLCTLSLPFQGVAAAAMASCGPVHQHQYPHEMAVSHGHVGAHADHDHSGMHPAHQVKADKCSACSSCCAGVAMVAPALRWQAPAQEPVVPVVLPSLLQPSFHPDGLDRPPRSRTA